MPTKTHEIQHNGQLLEMSDGTIYTVSNFRITEFRKPTGEKFTMSGGTVKNLSRNRKRDRILRRSIGWKKWKEATRNVAALKGVE